MPLASLPLIAAKISEALQKEPGYIVASLMNCIQKETDGVGFGVEKGSRLLDFITDFITMGLTSE